MPLQYLYLCSKPQSTMPHVYHLQGIRDVVVAMVTRPYDLHSLSYRKLYTGYWQ